VIIGGKDGKFYLMMRFFQQVVLELWFGGIFS